MRTFSVSFFSGTLLLLVLPKLPTLDAWFWGSVLLLLGGGLILRRYGLAKAISAFVLGATYAIWVASGVLAERLPVAWEGNDQLLSGVIADIPEYADDGLRFLFAVDTPQYRGHLRVAWYADDVPMMQAGERWQLLIRGKRPNGFQNAGGFDYEKWLFAQHIGGSGYVRKSAQNQRLAAAPWYSVNALRQHLQARISAALPNSSVTGLVQGLAIAYTATITQEQWAILRDTGTIHLLAISGLHITMVAGLGIVPVWLLWRLFPLLALYIPLRIAAAVMGGLLATGYALLAGFNIPTQRTLIMLLVLMAGLVWRRQIPFSVTLSVALLLVVVLDPLASLSVGFWLSFLTVSLLVWLGMRRWQVGKASAISLQLLLSLGIMPLTAGFFGMVSLSAPLANLLAIPLVTFVVTPLVLVGIALSGWHSAAAWVWQLAGLLLEGLMQVLQWLAALPLSALHLPLIPWYWLGLAVCGFLLLVAPRGVPSRWLGIVLILPAATLQPDKPAAGAFRVTVLDVGQGLATVVQTARHTLVFDSGPKAAESFDTGQLVVLPWLYGAGIRHIDRLMISHADNDHSGGAKALLTALPVKQVWTNVPDLFADYNPVLCRAGQQWEWDGVIFTVLHPSENFSDKRENNYSCVLKVANTAHSTLLTADIERVAEHWLLKQAAGLRAEVLLVPHHGSQSSSSPAFIDAVAPRLAIMTNGYRNRFNHPHPSVTERYTARDIKLLSSANSGELRLDFPASALPLTLREWRKAQPHIWLRESAQ